MVNYLSNSLDTVMKPWDTIANYNKKERECEYKEEKLTTLLADIPPTSLLCKVTGTLCSFQTCPIVFKK